MKRIALIMSIFCVVLTGCGTTANKAATTAKAPATKNINATPLVLSPAKFATHIDTRKIGVECDMLTKLNDSIVEHATAYSLKLDMQKDGESLPVDQATLVIEYVDVQPNKWRLFAIRPYSVATVKASIYKNGKVFKEIQKGINSSVAFGACDRLEKIAIAHGKYIARWASGSGY